MELSKLIEQAYKLGQIAQEDNLSETDKNDELKALKKQCEQILASRPTCTANERLFLDEIRKKCKWFPYSNGLVGMKPDGHPTTIFQVNFEVNLKGLVDAD